MSILDDAKRAARQLVTGVVVGNFARLGLVYLACLAVDQPAQNFFGGYPRGGRRKKIRSVR